MEMPTERETSRIPHPDPIPAVLASAVTVGWLYGLLFKPVELLGVDIWSGVNSPAEMVAAVPFVVVIALVLFAFSAELIHLISGRSPFFWGGSRDQ